MKGLIIVRLVDVVLLLLLSLMAVASIRGVDVEPPVSPRADDRWQRLHPLQIAITAGDSLVVMEGSLRGGNGGEAPLPITLGDVYGLALSLEAGRVVEFIADRRSSARLLIDANRAVQAAGGTAVFVVELGSKDR